MSRLGIAWDELDQAEYLLELVTMAAQQIPDATTEGSALWSGCRAAKQCLDRVRQTLGSLEPLPPFHPDRAAEAAPAVPPAGGDRKLGALLDAMDRLWDVQSIVSLLFMTVAGRPGSDERNALGHAYTLAEAALEEAQEKLKEHQAEHFPPAQPRA